MANEMASPNRIRRTHLREDLVGPAAGEFLDRSRRCDWAGFISVDSVLADDILPEAVAGLPLAVVGRDEVGDWLVAVHHLSAQLVGTEHSLNAAAEVLGNNPAAVLVVPAARAGELALEAAV